LSEVLRRMKFEPGPVRIMNCAPLNPPRLTSYGVVTTEVVTFASRGMLELPNGLPLSVVLFWSAERPSTEKPAGSPSAPVTGVTPGTVAAMALRSPCWLAATAALVADCSVPLMSGCFPSLRPTRFRSAATRTVSSMGAARWSLASATRISWSAVRFSSNRRGVKPMAVKPMK
jgi:hypothetical protein